MTARQPLADIAAEARQVLSGPGDLRQRVGLASDAGMMEVPQETD
jgi:hypothetical protein